MRPGALNLSRRLKPKEKVVVVDPTWGVREATVTAIGRGKITTKFLLRTVSSLGGGDIAKGDALIERSSRHYTTVRRRDETITWARAGTVEADALLAAEALR